MTTPTLKSTVDESMLRFAYEMGRDAANDGTDQVAIIEYARTFKSRAERHAFAAGLEDQALLNFLERIFR